MTPSKRSSSNTLFQINQVADEAGVARQTLYNWLAAKPPIITHTYDVNGIPVFTREEVDEAKRVAKVRREAMNVIRLPK